LARSGAGFTLRAPNLADFRISADCKSVEVMAAPATPAVLIRHLLLDQVLPRVVAQRGGTVLHASAVSVNKTAVAFLGASGAGKSTIASWLHQKGHALLSDDCVAMDTGPDAFRIIPSYAGARLWDDSPAVPRAGADSLHPVADCPNYSDKLRLQVGASAAQEALPLKGLLVLEPKSAAPHNKVSLAALKGVEATMALVEHSFRLDMIESGRAAEHIKKLGAFVTRGLPIYRLSYPHSPAALTEVRHLVYTLPPASGSETGIKS
jgi:hypothetical protein